jgi:hypothetical protein
MIEDVQNWTFLTNHGRALLCIARDPEARLREIAISLGITERRAHGIVSDLADAGYVVRTKVGRRNRYEVQTHLPLPELTSQEQAIGDVLAVLTGGNGRRKAQRRSPSTTAGGGWEGIERRAGPA